VTEEAQQHALVVIDLRLILPVFIVFFIGWLRFLTGWMHSQQPVCIGCTSDRGRGDPRHKQRSPVYLQGNVVSNNTLGRERLNSNSAWLRSQVCADTTDAHGFSLLVQAETPALREQWLAAISNVRETSNAALVAAIPDHTVHARLLLATPWLDSDVFAEVKRGSAGCFCGCLRLR
jgi:hypothetical protein